MFVTNNEADFLSLARVAGLHSGLVVLPQGGRETQWLLLDKALDHVEMQATRGCSMFSMLPPLAYSRGGKQWVQSRWQVLGRRAEGFLPR